MHPKSIRVRDQNDLMSVLNRNRDPKTNGLRRPYGVAGKLITERLHTFTFNVNISVQWLLL